MATPLIQTKSLSKRYGSTDSFALKNLTLSVSPGEVYGFLGANGAGKSTTIRTLMGFLKPSGGSAEICGLDIIKNSVEIKKHVGYLAGEVELYGRMTGQEFIKYMSALQPPKQPDYASHLVKIFKAETKKPLGSLSKGNRQKFGIIQAFVHQPEVLILDEPTSGLDPLMQEEFFRLIAESKQRGAAVFVSSHNFAEVQRMCDRIGFIRQGKMVAEQSLADLANKASHTFVLTFADKAPLTELQKLPRAHVEVHSNHHLTISVEGELSQLFQVLGKHHVTRLEQQEINLEEEFMRFYGDTHNE